MKEILKIFLNTKDQNFERDIFLILNQPDVKKHFDTQIYSFNFSEENKNSKKTQSQKFIVIYEKTLAFDFFIYDQNSCDFEELRFHIRLFKNLNLDRLKKLILISNIMTWQKTNLVEKNKEPEEKSFIEDICMKKRNFNKTQENEEELEKEENQEEPEQEEEQSIQEDQSVQEQEETTTEKEYVNLNEKDYYKRKSHENFLEMLQLENMSLNLAKSKINFQVNVLCPGIIYGQGEKVLYELFKISWLYNPNYLNYINIIDENNFSKFKHLSDKKFNKLTKFSFLSKNQKQEEQEEKKEQIQEEGEEKIIKKNQIEIKGNNEIPMIHYQDFLMYLKFIMLEDVTKIPFIFAFDYNKKRKQKQIIKAISKGVNSGNIQPIGFEECTYSIELKEHLLLNIKYENTSIFKKYNKKLKEIDQLKNELKERQEQLKEKQEQLKESEGQIEENEIDQEEIKLWENKQKQVDLFKQFEYNWKCKKGIIKHIKEIKEEFIKKMNLKSNKICIIGPVYSGKTKLAEYLSKIYQLNIISQKDLLVKYSKLENELGEKIRNYIEEKKQYILEENENKIQKAQNQKKKYIPKKLNPENIFIELPDEMLIEIYQKELSQNIYFNRGYILDGFPFNYVTAFKTFKSKIIREKIKNK